MEDVEDQASVVKTTVGEKFDYGVIVNTETSLVVPPDTVKHTDDNADEIHSGSIEEEITLEQDVEADNKITVAVVQDSLDEVNALPDSEIYEVRLLILIKISLKLLFLALWNRNRLVRV